MNIEISNGVIEAILEKQISERVQTWFNEDENRNVIQDCVREVVSRELGNLDVYKLIARKASEITSKEVIQRVGEKISYDIASAYCDRYGG